MMTLTDDTISTIDLPCHLSFPTVHSHEPGAHNRSCCAIATPAALLLLRFVQGDPVSDPVTLAGNPGGYGSYVLRQLGGHNIVSVQHNGGPFNGTAARAGDEQAGDTNHGLDCLDYWIGLNATNPTGLKWDV